MSTKRELQEKAQSLMNTEPNKSVDLWLEVYDNYPEEFNQYDAINLLKGLRKTGKKEINILPGIIEPFKDNAIVTGLCGWYVFDTFIKHREPRDILNYEHKINQLLSCLHQKDLSEDDTYPCPLSIIIFALLEAHANNLFNANKIYQYCKLLDPNFLSKKTSSYQDKKGETKVNPSNYETYFQYYTKSCEKLNKAEECIEACNIGLNGINDFHYDNDLWFKMRIARSLFHLKKWDDCEIKYLELINSRAGSTKYFLFQEYSVLLYKLKRYEESWRQSLRAGVILNDVKYCAGLLLLQSRLLARLGRIEEAEKFAKIIFAGIQEKLWNNSNEYQKLISYFKIQNTDKKAGKQFEDLYSVNKDELYKTNDLKEGIIVFIHKNGKVGKIKNTSDETINFSKNSFHKKVHQLAKFDGAKVSYIEDFNYKSKIIAENIKIIELKKEDNLVGVVMNGDVQNIVEFGIFIDLDNNKSGLAHMSVLPKNFKDLYSFNQKVKVKIIKVTNKGLSLKIVD